MIICNQSSFSFLKMPYLIAVQLGSCDVVLDCVRDRHPNFVHEAQNMITKLRIRAALPTGSILARVQDQQQLCSIRHIVQVWTTWILLTDFPEAPRAAMSTTAAWG